MRILRQNLIRIVHNSLSTQYTVLSTLLLLVVSANLTAAQIDIQKWGKVTKKPAGAQGPTEFQHPNANERINLGAAINSPYSELFPVLTPDEMIMFFTRKGDSTNEGFKKNPNDEDIWVSVRQPDLSWGKAVKLPQPLNTENYDGVRAINNSGTKLYLQNVYREDGTRGKGFSVSSKESDGSYGFPDSLAIDDYYNDTTVSMMAISNDEQHIIFSLQRKDGKGAHDLYHAKNLGGNHWSRPEPIADLNTPGDDIAPFIAYEDRTLYFATNGRGGVGLHDIFVTRRTDDTWLHWSQPTNLGEPINTPSFDAYFMVTAKGDTAYLSSAHETSTRGFGRSDIWKIGLKPKLRPGFDLPTALLPNGYTPEEMEAAVFRLDNVLFDVGKANIRDISKRTLDTVAMVMNAYPNLAIEVQGHTDSDGDPKKNMVLSQSRAEAVRTYLVAGGVPATRISAKGYGMTRPIAPNTTPQGKQLNRRVVIEVKGSIGKVSN